MLRPQPASPIVGPCRQGIRNIRLGIILRIPCVLGLSERGGIRGIERILQVADGLFGNFTTATKINFGGWPEGLIQGMLNHTGLSQLLLLRGYFGICGEQLLFETKQFRGIRDVWGRQ